MCTYLYRFILSHVRTLRGFRRTLTTLSRGVVVGGKYIPYTTCTFSYRESGDLVNINFLFASLKSYRKGL
jgi:hypothetical protein